MTSKTRACIAALIAACACTDASAPGTALDAPPAVNARALSIHVVRLEWTAGTGLIEGYRVERRVNLTGPFSVVASAVPHSQGGGLVTLLDADVEPETFYGYRVISLGALGQESGPSVIAGTRTPPVPGIEVQTGSTVPVPEAADPDGYWVTVEGPSSAAGPLGISDRRRFSPLAPGTYTVSLSGVRSSCDVQGAPTQAVTVSDTGVQTVAGVGFRVVCRDPARGRIRGNVVAQGDSADENGYRVTAVGLLADTTLPPSERIFNAERTVGKAGGVFDFGELRPGAYEITLEDVASHCTIGGARAYEVTVAPLSEDTVRFEVGCLGAGNVGRPYVLRNAWSAATVGTGGRATLTVTLDLSANPAERVSAVQAELIYNPSVLRFDSAAAGALDHFSVNNNPPGVMNWAAITLSTSPSGSVTVGRFHFTAIGSAGTTAATRTGAVLVAAGDGNTELQELVRIVEDTLAISAAGTNQPPVGDANGPYAGQAGIGISFSAAGSSDPDGTIATYGWTFGDGSSATGATPSHSYATAGTYTATLTVTDNLGATDTDQATVTVAAGGGNQPPVARANGPYGGVAGSAIALSAAGSSDPDGTIVSYSWAFGDGASATGATPTHSYAAAGTYTATLTVTDNLGATATNQATVTVTAPGSTTPYNWRGTFGAVNPADSVVALTISLDLTTDIVETPGPEALATFVIDSLKWNPAVLRYHAFNWGPGGAGVVQTSFTSQGKLIVSSFTLPTTANSGVIELARIRFKAIAPGTTTTATAVGPLIGTTATGSYNYRPRTTVVEVTFTAP